MTEISVDEARRIVREAEAAEDARMRAEIQSWSSEDLYNAAEECDSEQGPEHCWRCAAYELWNQREQDTRASMVGGIPRRRRNYNGPVSDLRAGDVLKHLPYPGNDYHGTYVEVVGVGPTYLDSQKRPVIAVSLRETNSSDEPFTVRYPAELTLSIWTDRMR